MKKLIFKHEFYIGLKDINSKKELKNKSILEFLENIACMHSDLVGLGMNDINKTGVTWVLLDWQLEIIKRPCYGNKLEIHTWTHYTKVFYSYRDFEVYVNGVLYAKATSKWLLLNIDKQKPERIKQELINKYEPEKDTAVFKITELEKINEQTQYDMEKQYEVRKGDIDINGHMHNLNYLDIAYEMLSDEDYINEPNQVRITYKKEIKLGDSVKCLYKKQGENHYVVLKSIDDKKIYSIIEMKV